MSKRERRKIVLSKDSCKAGIDKFWNGKSRKQQYRIAMITIAVLFVLAILSMVLPTVRRHREKAKIKEQIQAQTEQITTLEQETVSNEILPFSAYNIEE